MGIEIPPDLQWVSYLAGSEWPKGDETAMFSMGDDWNGSAEQLGSLIPKLEQVSSQTRQVLAGETGDAAAQQFQMLFSGDHSVDNLVIAMSTLGSLGRNTGTQIEYTKLQVLSALAIAAAEIAYLLAMADWTAGLSVLEIRAVEGITITAIRTIGAQALRRLASAVTQATTKTAVPVFVKNQLPKLLAAGVREAVQETVISEVQELAIQGFQIAEGHRDGFGVKQIVEVGAGAAVGTHVGSMLHGRLSHALGNSTTLVGKALKGAITHYGVGFVGNVAGSVSTGGGFDTVSLFGGPATGGLHGALHGVAHSGGEAHGGAGTSGDSGGNSAAPADDPATGTKSDPGGDLDSGTTTPHGDPVDYPNGGHSIIDENPAVSTPTGGANAASTPSGAVAAWQGTNASSRDTSADGQGSGSGASADSGASSPVASPNSQGAAPGRSGNQLLGDGHGETGNRATRNESAAASSPNSVSGGTRADGTTSPRPNGLTNSGPAAATAVSQTGSANTFPANSPGSALRVTATRQLNELSGGSAPAFRSSLSAAPSAAPSRGSSGAPIAHTADGEARKLENDGNSADHRDQSPVSAPAAFSEPSSTPDQGAFTGGRSPEAVEASGESLHAPVTGMHTPRDLVGASEKTIGSWNFAISRFGEVAVAPVGQPLPTRHTPASVAARYPWLADVNPQRDSTTPMTNCVISAISFVISEREGQSFEAPLTEQLPGMDLLNFHRQSLGLGDDAHQVSQVTNFDSVTHAMGAAGPGAMALMAVLGDNADINHVYVAVVDDRGVAFLDPQRGTVAAEPVGATKLTMLPLTQGIPAPQGSSLLTAEQVQWPQPDAPKPDPPLPARIGDQLVLGGTDVLEEFHSGEGGARDQGFEHIKQLVVRESSKEVWQKNEMDVYGLFSDRGLRPQVPGMLRGGQTVKHVIHLTKDRSLALELRLDGAHEDSKLENKGEFKNEFEHTSDSTSALGRSVQRRVVYHGGVQGSVGHSAASDTSALIASRAHDSGLTEVRVDRQISGAQTAEAATRFRGQIQASILHWFSDSPTVHKHGFAYHTQVAVPTRDVNDRGEDAPPSQPPDQPSAPPRVKYTRALSGSDVVTNLWLLPDQHDSVQPPKHGDTEPNAKTPRGPRPQKVPEFVRNKPMRTAFEKAYGKGSAQLAIEEAGKWLTVERLQANLHGMTNKQPLVLEFESIPGARLEVHAFVEPLDTASDTRSAAGDGDVTNPKPARRMMRATGETKETEFHFGTETDTSRARIDAVTVTYQAPVPGRVRGQGGTDTGEATGGIDANLARGNVHSDTQSRQFRIRSTLKDLAAGQAWHGQVRLRFVMHAPGAVSPSHRDAPFKGAVHETRVRFDVLAEKSETTPAQDYTDQTVYAPPERIWGEPPGERNYVAKSSWWRIGTGHRTVRTQDGETRTAHESPPKPIPRGEKTAPLQGLGSMDRVTNLDVSGLHGMLDSMGRRAFGNEWKNVRSEVSSWHHLNRIRAALPAMTQHSPLTRTKLSGPNSKTKVSFTADIEQLTYKRTIKTLSSPSMEITEGSASTTERNGQVSAIGALGGRGGDVNGGSVLGEAMAGATETVRDSERVRDQQRVAVGTKFDQPMAIFEGWVRLDGTMTGSKSTVHESGLFPVEIAIPLTELQGSRTHDFKLPPTFTRDSQTGFIDEPRPKPPRDPVDQAPRSKNPLAPKTIGHKGGQPPLLRPPPIRLVTHDSVLASPVSDDTADSRTPLIARTGTVDSVLASPVSESKPDTAVQGLNDAADGWKQLPPVKLLPPDWEWTSPVRMEQPPKPPAHALEGSWHPSDMLIGLDPASGLLEAMRHDLAPALGTSLDDAVDNLANQFGPRVLAARLTHQSGQEWSHDIPAAGGTITVKVRPVREPEPAEYVGTSGKFETDLSIESQSSAAQGHGASLRTTEGFRVQISIPHGSVSFGARHSGSVRPKEDPGGARLSGLNTPTYSGEIEHRVPVRTRTTEVHDLFRQPIRFEISYEKQATAKLLKDIPESPQAVRLNGVFSYPKKTPTAVDSETAGPPPVRIEIHQAVVKIRPHGDAAPTGDAGNQRTANEDQVATHILDTMAAHGTDIYGKKWPSVRAELTEHVKTMAIQGKLGDYTRGETKTINLTSVRGGKVVLGAHLDTMNRADSKATTEFYSGDQQLLTAGVSSSKGNNWQGFIQAQADLLPTGDTVNVSALASLGGGVGSERHDTRTNNTTTGTLFRKKVPTLTHVGTVTINADMSRSIGEGRISDVASAKVEFLTRESPTDKLAHVSHSPRDGIIQKDADRAGSHSDERRGPCDTDLPPRGLSDKSIVRKLIDGERLRSVTLAHLREHKIKDADEVADGLTDTLVASKLGDMTRVDDGDGIPLVRHGKVGVFGRAAVQKLDFDRIEHEGGNAYVLNDVNQTRRHQHTATREVNARLMVGPHGELAPDLSAYLLAGGGIGGRGRVDAIFSQAARVAANAKFARPHAVFDGTTRITLTVRDGETRHELGPIDVHGPILIPESETRSTDPLPPEPEPIVAEPKDKVPDGVWLGAWGALGAGSGDEPASNPPRASLSVETRLTANRPRTPAGSPIAHAAGDTTVA